MWRFTGLYELAAASWARGSVAGSQARRVERPVPVRANNGKLARRYKAEVVIDAATAVVKAGIVTADDFRAHQPREGRTSQR